jgi:predicted nucleic acid-binding protein
MVEAMLQDVRRQVTEAQESWRQRSTEDKEVGMPFITLTYAQSIDGSLTAERGEGTKKPHKQGTKADLQVVSRQANAVERTCIDEDDARAAHATRRDSGRRGHCSRR